LPYEIPYSKPRWGDAERAHLNEALARGPLGPAGNLAIHCAESLKRKLNDTDVVLTASVSDAAEAAALLLDLGPGDEVILPSLAPSPIAAAVVTRTVTPCFVDITEDTLCVDPDEVEKAVTNRTKAIVVNHHGGLSAPMDRLCQIASYHRLPLVEDVGAALFGQYRDRALGAMGDLAVLDFDGSGDGSIGLGGGLAVVDQALLNRARLVCRGGLEERNPGQSAVCESEWIDYGSCAGMNELTAALLKARLARQYSDRENCKRLWQRLFDGLEQWAAGQDVRLPQVLPESEPSYAAFHLLLPTPEMRDALLTYLQERGIEARKPAMPLHTTRMGKALGAQPSLCRTTEKTASRLLYLPMRPDLSEAEVDKIVSAVSARHSLEV
jgi:dTDP-4-amino-4,6-dideoxygalactose transaminase